MACHNGPNAAPDQFFAGMSVGRSGRQKSCRVCRGVCDDHGDGDDDDDDYCDEGYKFCSVYS